MSIGARELTMKLYRSLIVVMFDGRYGVLTGNKE
jgi:hypothetical protein